jgi:hypothetical protein
MSDNNLDRLCAQYGWQIAHSVHEEIDKSAESHITKSLGVLQENGVYAFFLYQESRGKTEKPGADKLKALAAELLNEALNTDMTRLFDPVDTPLEAIRKKDGLADDLDALLLAKRLLEQALIYARYHAKALEG